MANFAFELMDIQDDTLPIKSKLLEACIMTDVDVSDKKIVDLLLKIFFRAYKDSKHQCLVANCLVGGVGVDAKGAVVPAFVFIELIVGESLKNRPKDKARLEKILQNSADVMQDKFPNVVNALRENLPKD